VGKISLEEPQGVGRGPGAIGLEYLGQSGALLSRFFLLFLKKYVKK
jgi:hypothetical protein